MMQRSRDILILVYWTTVVSCTRHIPSVEKAFFHHVLRQEVNAPDVTCSINGNQMYAACQEVFLRPHYRYELKVFQNRNAYASGAIRCDSHPLTFTSEPKNFPANRQQQMITCFGRHTPIQTNWKLDDYLLTFHISFSPDMQRLYVYRMERRGGLFWFRLYEELIDMPPLDTLPHQITDPDILRESVLETIETVNSWRHEIENIYVREMALANVPVSNQLQGIDSTGLINLCIYILGGAPFGNQEYLLDSQMMNEWNKISENIELYFKYEEEYIGITQLSYPCYGRHVSKKPVDNQPMVNKYRIISGVRPNSVFVLEYLSNLSRYVIKHYHENLDLRGLVTLISPPVRIQEIPSGMETHSTYGMQPSALMPPPPAPQQPLALMPPAVIPPQSPITTQQQAAPSTDVFGAGSSGTKN